MLRDFEGLSGHLQGYKVDIARAMLEMCTALDSQVLLACSSTSRTFRVFSGKGVHSDALADLVLRLDAIGYRGDYSYEVFNDDCQQLPLDVVAERARRSTLWLRENVLHRAAPLPEWTRQPARR